MTHPTDPHPPRPALGLIVMASGSSRRFGACKLLADCGGVPLIARTLSALPRDRFSRAALCAARPDLLELARQVGYLPLRNCRADEGISASIRLGLSAMKDMDGVLFAVADQPFLNTNSILRLINSFLLSPNAIWALSWKGRRGNPVLFPAALFPELEALSGDTGGSAVIRAHPELLRLTEAGSAEELKDVDRPEDLPRPADFAP